MKKLIYILLTFPICVVMNVWQPWAGFTAALCVFDYRKLRKSVLWEIPMALLALSIISDVSSDDTEVVLRILLPLSAVLTAYARPRRLFFVLAVSSTMLFLKNSLSLSVMWGVMWYCTRCVFLCKFRPVHFTTKRKVLQGNYLTENSV